MAVDTATDMFMSIIRDTPRIFLALDREALERIKTKLLVSRGAKDDLDGLILSSCAMLGYAVGLMLRSGDIYIGKVSRDEEGT